MVVVVVDWCVVRSPGGGVQTVVVVLVVVVVSEDVEGDVAQDGDSHAVVSLETERQDRRDDEEH